MLAAKPGTGRVVACQEMGYSSSTVPADRLFISLLPSWPPPSCLPPPPSRITAQPTNNTTSHHQYLRFVEPRSWRRCTLLLGTRTPPGEISSSIPTVSF